LKPAAYQRSRDGRGLDRFTERQSNLVDIAPWQVAQLAQAIGDGVAIFTTTHAVGLQVIQQALGPRAAPGKHTRYSWRLGGRIDGDGVAVGIETDVAENLDV